MGEPRQNPFQLPPQPRTGRDLIRWILFEYPRLEDWSQHLTRRRGLALYLRAVPWILLLATGVYLLSLAVVVALELPLYFPAQFKPAVVQIFTDYPGFGERLIGLLSVTGGRFATWLAGGLAGGIGFFLSWAVGFLRLPFYLPQAAVALIRLDPDHNPYLWDAGVYLPIWGARRRLTEAAFRDPETGTKFAGFLLEYRPLQRGLAAAVLHAAQAGRWRLRPLDPDVLTPPPVPEDQPAYAPGTGWLRALADLRQDLMAARGQTQIRADPGPPGSAATPVPAPGFDRK